MTITLTRFFRACAAAIGLWTLNPAVAEGTIDLTGYWDVQVALSETTVANFRWVIMQTGDSLVVNPGRAPAFSGVVDAATRAIRLESDDSCTRQGHDPLIGEVAADGLTFSVSGTVFTPRGPLSCHELNVVLSAVRLPCGDGVLDQGESCDYGIAASAECCSLSCEPLENGKVCDDGDPTTPSTACLNGTCVDPTLCGNGRLDAGEACDDGNRAAVDCCSSSCLILPDGTLCDDGLTETGFGVCIAASCTTPPNVLETQVNELDGWPQWNSSVSCAADGGFVVGWNAGHQFVGARRFNDHAERLGIEARDDGISSTTFAFPRVASAADGSFVATWTWPVDYVNRVVARRFDSSGNPRGPRFDVSSVTADARLPAIASDAQGNFVIAWQQSDAGIAQMTSAIAARRYDSSGTALGTEIAVSDAVHASGVAGVAVDARGGFVITWQEGTDVMYVRQYTHRGNVAGPLTAIPFGSDHRVVRGPRVGASADGSFVVTWNVYDGVMARRFSSSGTALVPDIEVPGTTGDVAVDPNGNFTIASVTDDGWGRGIRAQRFTAAGLPSGEALQVNGFTYFDQFAPSVCAAPGGDFVISWTSEQQDGSGSGIFARRIDVVDQPTPTPIPLPCAGDCNEDNEVSIAELVIGVTIALDQHPLASCREFDRDDSNRVTVDELLGAIRALLDGC